jgi:hypothetical protein
MISKRIKRRLISLACSIAMLLSVIPFGAMAAENQFSDMPQDWSTKSLEAAVKNGLLKGFDGKIMPQSPLTRAEMATIINRAFGATKKASNMSFSDLVQSDWSFEEFQKAVAMKTFEGENGRMNPNQGITREQAFLCLSRAFSLGTGDESGLTAFSDGESVSSWARSGVAVMVQEGYVEGDNGILNPQGIITRAEFAKLMDNIITTYFNQSGVYSSLPEGSVMINVPDVTLENVTVKGNLILGDGIGEGDITLNNVKVEGDTIVRGGGINSFIVKGSSNLGKVIVSKVDGHVRVSVEGDAKVELVEVKDGKDDVKLEGTFNQVSIDAAVPVLLENATVESLDVAETAKNAEITVGKETKVATANIQAEGVKLAGAGKVTTTNVKANNVEIGVVGTKAVVDNGVTGVTSNGHDLKSGATTTTTNPSSGGTSGGGTSGGGTNNPTTYLYSATVSVTVNSSTVSYQNNNNAATENIYTDILKGTLTNVTAKNLLENVAERLSSAEYNQMVTKINNRKTRLLDYLDNSTNITGISNTADLRTFVYNLSVADFLVLNAGTVDAVDTGATTLISKMDSFYSLIRNLQPASGYTEETVLDFLTSFVNEAIDTGITIKVNGTNITSTQIKAMIQLVRSNPTVSTWYDSGFNSFSVSGLTFLTNNATATLTLQRTAN